MRPDGFRRFFYLIFFIMNFLEKDLEQIVYESDNDLIYQRGLVIGGRKFRQLRIGNYGIADLVTFDKPFRNYIKITIYEFKKGVAGIDAFLQAIKYMKGIDRYLKYRKVSFNYSFDIVICGKEIELDDYIYLTDYIFSDEDKVLNTLSNYKYDYKVDGITFTKLDSYKLTNEGFSRRIKINDIF